MKSHRLHLALLVLVAFLPPLISAALQPVPLPEQDALDYLAYARSLFLARTYAATPAGPKADTKPGREPLYPAVIAGLATISPGLADSLTRCAVPVEECRQGYRSIAWLHAVLVGAAALMSALALRALGGRPWAALLTGAYVAANLHLQKEFRFVQSDFLALFLVAGLTWMLAARNRAGAILFGTALTFVKAIFAPFMLLLGAAIALFGFRQRFLLAGGVAMILVAGGANFAWNERNVALFGTASDGRDTIALSTREALDHMTQAEHGLAWLWWMRGPGKGLVRKYFPESDWHRHEWYAPDGFYMVGQFGRPPERLEKAIVLREIAADWKDYVLTMPVLFYRGLWFDDFMLAGFPLLVFVLWRSARTRRFDQLVALSPGLWSLLVYPAVSYNVPRYQYTALAALALGVGLAVGSHYQRRPGRARLDPAAMPRLHL